MNLHDVMKQYRDRRNALDKAAVPFIEEDIKDMYGIEGDKLIELAYCVINKCICDEQLNERYRELIRLTMLEKDMTEKEDE